MKRIYTEATIKNYGDIEKLASGYIREDEVRMVKINGRVDTGATALFLPKQIANELGLRELEEVVVRYGNGKTERKRLASVVQIEILGRKSCAFPIIEEGGDEVLIGNPILEDMDFLVDTKEGKLYPRPGTENGPVAECL